MSRFVEREKKRHKCLDKFQKVREKVRDIRDMTHKTGKKYEEKVIK